MKLKTLGTLLLVLAGIPAANATQTVRETWDHYVSQDTPIGQAKGSAIAVGFEPALNWIANSNTPILDVDNNSGNTAPGLPNSFGASGNIWSDVYNHGLGLLTDYEDPHSWAVRQLVPSSQINFNANGTYYFSIQFQHGNDGAMGMGFANGTNDGARFVGAGITRASYSSGRFTNLDTSYIELGNTLYITRGTLGQPGDPTDPYVSYEGPYMVMAYATNAIGVISPSSPSESGLLVGKLTTSVGGSSTLSVSWLTNGITIPTDPSTVVWNASYSFNETANMTHFLLWLTASSYNNQIDALRVATTWGEVVGIESKISISPTNVVPSGQAVTFSSQAFRTPLTYQWTSNGTNILNATNATYAIASPAVADSGAYTLVVSNAYGLSTNNPVIQLTVTAANPPVITQQPDSTSKYVGANQTFTVGVIGTPPFSYQWTHAGTNLPAGTNASLVLANLTAANAGVYNVTISSPYPPAAISSNASLTISAPPGFASAAIAQGVSSLWPFNELTNDPASLTTNGLILHDYAGGLNGIALDITNMNFGLEGPNLPGFSGLTSLQTLANGQSSQANLPVTQYSNTMTMVCWMNASTLNSQGIMLNTGGLIAGSPGDGCFGIDYRLGSLGSQWGPGGSMWGSGITLPVGNWVFVALVVQPAETTVYAGTDPTTLQMVTRSSIEGTSYTNTSGTQVGRLTFGRTDYTWAQGDGHSTAGSTAQFSDAAIFYQALSPTTITNLFLAGVGVQIVGTPDGSGNLILNWLPGGTLQEATNVNGPYTDVSGATAPYSVPMTGPQLFYRVKR
jgi:hypothetical protein